MARKAFLILADGSREPVEADGSGCIKLPPLGSHVVGVELEPPPPPPPPQTPLPSKLQETFPLGKPGPRVVLSVLDD